MVKANNNIKILKPRIPSELRDFKLTGENMSDEDLISGALITDCFLENHNSDKVSFNEVLFRNVALTDVSLENCDFTDVRFENCDLSNVNFALSSIHRAEFSCCKLMGVNLSETVMKNVVFTESNGQYANFRFAECGQTAFYDCNLRFSDFQESQLSKVEFKNTDLVQSQFYGTKLNGIDLSSCEIDGLGARIEDVKGVIVTAAQAISLSGLMGIVIKMD